MNVADGFSSPDSLFRLSYETCPEGGEWRLSGPLHLVLIHQLVAEFPVGECLRPLWALHQNRSIMWRVWAVVGLLIAMIAWVIYLGLTVWE